MRDLMSDENPDIERLIAVIGAPPAAPMAIVRQQLEHGKGDEHHGLLPRLFGAFLPKAGQ
ncbi:hypothetical protein [Yoonia sp.]|uniref:hypothetical protein n=1 Tax=Yoonia sp. TaxID=2212373 RepID=UPI00391AE01E